MYGRRGTFRFGRAVFAVALSSFDDELVAAPFLAKGRLDFIYRSGTSLSKLELEFDESSNSNFTTTLRFVLRSLSPSESLSLSDIVCADG